MASGSNNEGYSAAGKTLTPFNATPPNHAAKIELFLVELYAGPAVNWGESWKATVF